MSRLQDSPAAIVGHGMIVKDEGATLLLITQPDHALLAGTIVAAIQTEPALQDVGRDVVLLATREHDNGWHEVDAAPAVDASTGRPRDFIAGPASMKHALWLRGIARVAGMHPRAGALVAEHALTVYGYRAHQPAWRDFFASITSMRDDLLGQLGITDSPAIETFARDYRVVRLGDALSLQFCNGWAAPQETLGYQSFLDGSTLTICPDPFGGATVPLRVLSRRIPARSYIHDGDLAAALSQTIPEVLAGQAKGIAVG